MEHDLPSGPLWVKHRRKPPVRLGNGAESRGRAHTQECAWSSTERATVVISPSGFLSS